MPTPTMALELDKANRALIERLRKLATETDQIEGYKEPHALRLAQLAEAVAERFGLHGHDLVALQYAALAHDLGERKLRREYLQRPSGLNWEEQLDLWRHPILGEQEAQELKLPRQTQLLVRWHHEWWNGTGYPDGLSGTAIPLGARILRAVDTYCALRAERPYRGAYDQQQAEQMLSDQAGIECDPQVVLTLLSVLAAERHKPEPEQPVASPESYETVPMTAISGDETQWFAPVAQENKAFSDAPPAAHPFAPSDLTEEIPAIQVEQWLERPPAEKTEASVAPAEPPPPPAPPKISFDAPTLRPGVQPPAPPVPPPAPLWTRLGQSDTADVPLSLDNSADITPEVETVAPEPEPTTIETEAVDLTSPTEPLMRSFAAAPPPASPEVPQTAAWTEMRGNEPTEEVSALTPEALAAATMPPSAAAESHSPLSARTPSLLIVPLSEVPDHFWLVAKWIYSEWWETPENSINVVSNALKEHLASTTVPQTFVALSGGQPIGSVSLVANDVPERPEMTPWIGSLYVLPEHREQGIGTQLLEGAFTRAKMQGVEAVYLATPGHTDFFTRLGWQILEREVGPRRLTILMRLS